MKTRFLYVAFAAIFAFVVFSSRTNGPANMGLGNRTGSPNSNGTCATGNCHGGGTYTNVAISMSVKNSFGNTVTSYKPGQTYTLEFNCTASGSPVGFGMQAVMFKSNNTSAGTMVSAVTANTRVVSGQYVEHSNVQANGVFRATWTAPVAGTGNLVLHGITLAVNDNNNDNGDAVGTNTQLALTEDITNINYSQASYCNNGNDPSPTLTGTTGGTYSASPAGLVIDANTGAIDVSASTAGNYTITYTYSGGETVTDAVAITAADVASINYTSAGYCQNATDPDANLSGATGGTFSAVPAGLAIDANTGSIDLSASTPGAYTIVYTSAGTCPTTATDNVEIQQADDASFSYTSNTYCQTSSDPVPTITGTLGGVFSSSPAGLDIDAATGEVFLASSTEGSYTVTYTTNAGACPDVLNVSFSVTASGDASFNYLSALNCLSSGSLTPVIFGIAGGSFSSEPAGISFSDTLGTVDLVNSLAGDYDIIYSVSGACAAADTFQMSLFDMDMAGIIYDNSSYCVNTDPNAVPTITGTGGGTFSADNGLVIDPISGEIDFSNFPTGTFTVQYATNNECPDTTTVTLDLQICGGIGNTIANNSLQLYPNPNTGIFNLQNDGNAANIEVLVYDVLGRLRLQQIAFVGNGESLPLQLENAENGIYLVKVQMNGETKTLKMSVKK